jgi:hypothetical protein
MLTSKLKVLYVCAVPLTCWRRNLTLRSEDFYLVLVLIQQNSLLADIKTVRETHCSTIRSVIVFNVNVSSVGTERAGWTRQDDQEFGKSIFSERKNLSLSSTVPPYVRSTNTHSSWPSGVCESWGFSGYLKPKIKTTKHTAIISNLSLFTLVRSRFSQNIWLVLRHCPYIHLRDWGKLW